MSVTENKPMAGILIGSDSAWPMMKLAADALKEFGSSSEAKVLSAHRDPHRLEEFVSGGSARGIKVFICGAGGAAHHGGVHDVAGDWCADFRKIHAGVGFAALHGANAAGRAPGAIIAINGVATRAFSPCKSLPRATRGCRRN